MEHNATHLRQILTDRFSDDELRTLCFDLGLDYDLLPGEGKGGKARELVSYLGRRDRLSELIEVGQTLRPDITWESEVHDLPKPAIPHNLPPRSEFIGREEEKRRVHEALQSRSYLISIDGIGGIGKTSLALEVAHECLHASRETVNSDGKTTFAGFIWASARDRDLTLNDFLDAVARTLDYPGIAQQPVEEKREAVERLLREQPYLLLVDNFETVTDEDIRDFLLKLPEPSKALITTREQTLRQVWAVSLKGLAKDEALELIRNSGRRLGLQALKQAEDRVLLRLYRATGGAPLAIKWAVGQIKQRGQSLDSVLATLHEARGDIFEDVFARSWRILSPDSQQVLMVMPIFATSASWDAIEATSNVHHFALDDAIGQLVEMSLIETASEVELKRQRYSIHPLTRSFSLARLCETPGLEHSTRLRLAAYYIERCKEGYGWGSIEGFPWFEAELPNLLSIVEWANEVQEWEIVASVFQYLFYFLGTEGYWQERVKYGKMALQAAEGLDDEWLIARFKYTLGWVLSRQDRFAEAEELLRACTQSYLKLGDKGEAIWALVTMAKATINRDDLESTRRALEEASELAEDVDYELVAPGILTARGQFELLSGNLDKARTLLLEALEATKRKGSVISVGSREIDLGRVAIAQGRLGEAESWFQKGLESSKKYDRQDNIAKATFGLARVQAHRKNFSRALVMALNTKEQFVRMGMKREVDEVNDFLDRLEREKVNE